MNVSDALVRRDQRVDHRHRPVLISDVEQMFSEALGHLLELEGFASVTVVPTFEDMVTAVDVLPEWPRPLCLMEIDGTESRAGSPTQLAAMRRLADRTLLVVVTRDRDPRDRARALATGIRAFLTKDQPAETVLAALDRVCDPNVARSGIDPLLGFIAGRSPDPVSSFLTAREQEVLQALVDGESTAGIASRLGVRPSTLRGYIQRVLMKLGVHSRAAAAAVAVQRGLARPGGRTGVSPEVGAGDRLAARR